MTKRLAPLFALVIFFIFNFSLVTQASLGETLLRVGSTGPDVVQLQTELNYLGYNVGTADGIFGLKTKAGVIAFQNEKSLSTDGIVGPITANALNAAYSLKLHTNKANVIIDTAKKYIGVPYQWGGESPTTGFDCSGFVQYVFAQNGINLPRISAEQFKAGTPVELNKIEPGDLIFFSIAKNGTADHVGIYIGDNQFINASSSKGVTIYTIGPYWTSVEIGAKRVF